MKRFNFTPTKTQEKIITGALGGLFVVLLVLLLGGHFGWLSHDEQQPDTAQSSSAVNPGVEGVQANPGSGVTSSSSPSATPEAGEEPAGLSKDDSAQWALRNVLPTWGSYSYSKYGADAGAWVASWSDKAGASSEFATQSQRQYLDVHTGVIRLNADSTAKIKEIKKVWSVDDKSGWKVVLTRHVQAEGVDVTEDLTWEFQVTRNDDGTSEIVSYSKYSGGHEKEDGH